jgi:hypothetical protein
MAYSTLHHRRRGMLLLMVMLMLALFMAIGAMLLTIAARARAAARAHMSATQQSAASDTVICNALDNALLSLLRGATSGTNGSVTINGTVENLLADKYGDPVTGTGATILSGSTSPLLTVNLPLNPTTVLPSRLNGRVFTTKPTPGDGYPASYRILGAIPSGTSAITCYLAPAPLPFSRPLPRSAFDFVINGREFTPSGTSSAPESWDAFDNANIWLAQPVIEAGQVTHFNRISFGIDPDKPLEDDQTGQIAPEAVDNDNDGVPDGAWIPSSFISGTVLPSQPSPFGGSLDFAVSYLVIDLDGRININAAGIAAPAGAPYAGTPNCVLGMGYGPADLDASLLFPVVLPAANGLSTFTSATTSPSGIWATLCLNGPSPDRVNPSVIQRRTPPLVGALHGRYGPNGVPGVSGDDTDATQLTSETGTNNYATTVSGTFATDSVGDLQGRLKVFMSGSSTNPQLTFFAAASPSDFVDDPYEMRLDKNAPRLGMVRRPSPASPGGNDDNPFTLSELERILRPNDSDSPQLPQRLAAGITEHAQRSRMTITTDSWDTTALTGTTARILEDTIASWTNATSTFSPDTAAGLRFNINRLVSGAAQEAEYCKGLYTLAFALGASTTDAAQWAVNALDFRDADSKMTRFEYDPNPSDGWTLTGSTDNVVWGAERPELLISSYAVGAGNISVTLRHPARSSVLQVANNTPIDREIIPPELGTAPNTLAFRQTPPIWRVRLENNNSGTKQTLATVDLADNATLAPGQTRNAILTAAPGPGDNTIFLERVADPANAFNAATNPFVAVDEIRLGDAVTAPLAWIHWPNRPFISQAELALVPAGKYPQSSNPLSSKYIARSTPYLVDATYVPSRFAGHSATVPNPTALNPIGFDKLPANQFSSWREPGKVNVNTLVTGTAPTVNDENNIVWTILMGGTSTVNPFPGKPRTRTVPAIPGGGGNPATPAQPGKKGIPGNPAQSVSQLLALTINASPPDPIATAISAADPNAMNAFFSYARAIRLANTATIRSQVFGIWITVRVTDNSPNAPSTVTKRMFAIVDRSIPVGYLPNQDLNVRDAIVLKRYLD